MRCVAFILSLNYFSFQAELFNEEYEANHPRHASGASVSSPSLTWESFDKDNAPPPFVFDAIIRAERTALMPVPAHHTTLATPPLYDIRDKSPPSLS